MKKIREAIIKIYSVGILLTFFLGALSAFGYIVALLIGGAEATKICSFIFNTYFVWIIRITAIIIGIGGIGTFYIKEDK